MVVTENQIPMPNDSFCHRFKRDQSKPGAERQKERSDGDSSC